MVTGQILDGTHLQAVGLDELAQPQELKELVVPVGAQPRAVHDHVRDPHLHGKLQVLVGEVVEAELESEVQDALPFFCGQSLPLRGASLCRAALLARHEQESVTPEQHGRAVARRGDLRQVHVV